MQQEPSTVTPTAREHGRRLHSGHQRRMPTMSVDTIKQTELTPSEREVLAADRERWQHMGGGGHLDDWLAYGTGLMIRRRLAMRMSFVNLPEGKGYARAFRDLMKADGLDTMDKTSISAVLWLHDDAERMNILREIRDAMTPGERSRLNSPISARQRVEKELKARVGGAEGNLRSSPVTIYKQRIAEQDRRIAELEARLSNDGSLFDLRRDSVDAIVAVLTNPSAISESKARKIASGVLAALKALQKPAG
jgi:hypothetical protein